mmetsp:Transcript_121065/g.349788  ORF Transcript_121065/g.349788 Transcript_121065/m.349788 type:complete len:229 (+) Transcript_121065:398-1084(+)
MVQQARAQVRREQPEHGDAARLARADPAAELSVGGAAGAHIVSGARPLGRGPAGEPRDRGRRRLGPDRLHTLGQLHQRPRGSSLPSNRTHIRDYLGVHPGLGGVVEDQCAAPQEHDARRACRRIILPLADILPRWPRLPRIRGPSEALRAHGADGVHWDCQPLPPPVALVQDLRLQGMDGADVLAPVVARASDDAGRPASSGVRPGEGGRTSHRGPRPSGEVPRSMEC